MLRLLVGMVAWLLLAAAGPAEAPPADFSGRQYIDSTGCVFLRDGTGWTPRLDPAGEAICGYPPTRLAQDDGAAPTLAENDPRLIPPGMDPVEAALLTEVAGVMGAPVPPPAEADAAAPGMDDIGAQITAGLAVAPRLAAAAATPPARTGDSRLCGLIGAAPAGPEVGARDLLGYCGAAVIEAAARQPLPVTGMKDSVVAADEIADASSAAKPVARVSGTEASASGADGKPPRAGRATLPERASRRVPGNDPMPSTPMIPAGARYFVLSRHDDDASAREAARRLLSEGFPTAIASQREETGRAVMAGPFPDREAMVRALDRLRRAGYANAVPR